MYSYKIYCGSLQVIPQDYFMCIITNTFCKSFKKNYWKKIWHKKPTHYIMSLLMKPVKRNYHYSLLNSGFGFSASRSQAILTEPHVYHITLPLREQAILSSPFWWLKTSFHLNGAPSCLMECCISYKSNYPMWLFKSHWVIYLGSWWQLHLKWEIELVD